MNKTKHMK